MKTLNEVIEELIYLSEIRGELDPEANYRTEQRIAALNAEYLRLQALEQRSDLVRSLCRGREIAWLIHPPEVSVELRALLVERWQPGGGASGAP